MMQLDIYPVSLADFADRMNEFSIEQIKGLQKSVNYLLAKKPEDQILQALKKCLQLSTLKWCCLFTVEKHKDTLPANYAEILPESLVWALK